MNVNSKPQNNIGMNQKKYLQAYCENDHVYKLYPKSKFIYNMLVGLLVTCFCNTFNINIEKSKVARILNGMFVLLFICAFSSLIIGIVTKLLVCLIVAAVLLGFYLLVSILYSILVKDEKMHYLEIVQVKYEEIQNKEMQDSKTIYAEKYMPIDDSGQINSLTVDSFKLPQTKNTETVHFSFVDIPRYAYNSEKNQVQLISWPKRLPNHFKGRFIS